MKPLEPHKNKNRYKAIIGGREYTIVGYAPMGHMRLVAKSVNKQMAEISELSPYLDTTRVAVLTAVNATSDLLELQIETEKYKEKIAALEKEMHYLKQEIKADQE